NMARIPGHPSGRSTPRWKARGLAENARTPSICRVPRLSFRYVAGISHRILEAQICRAKDPRSVGASNGAHKIHAEDFSCTYAVGNSSGVPKLQISRASLAWSIWAPNIAWSISARSPLSGADGPAVEGWAGTCQG